MGSSLLKTLLHSAQAPTTEFRQYAQKLNSSPLIGCTQGSVFPASWHIKHIFMPALSQREELLSTLIITFYVIDKRCEREIKSKR